MTSASAAAEPRFHAGTAEEEVAAWVDAAGPADAGGLVTLLDERNPLYDGRGANAVVRLRGYILAAFARTGLPDEAFPFVLEELQTGHEAYGVAAAARALRGMPAPTDRVVPYLLRAVENIRFADDVVTFDGCRPRWPVENGTTALAEIFETLGWLSWHAAAALPALEEMATARAAEFSARNRAHIVRAGERIRAGAAPAPDAGRRPPAPLVSLTRRPPRARGGPAAAAGIALQDQDGAATTYGAFFSAKPCVVAFFYTRCANPEKCSATITRMAQLQRRLVEEGLDGRVKTAAITYDSEYDLPPRLAAYGANRGFRFGPDHRMLRTRGGFQALNDLFQLGVNFTGATVNRHRIELFLLDACGEVAVTFSRLQWEVDDVLRHLRELLPPPP